MNMNGRLDVRWILVGALAIAGGIVVSAWPLTMTGVAGSWGVYATVALGAALGGGVMVVHAPLHPRREPLAAGALVAGLFALMLVLPEGDVWWIIGGSALRWVIMSVLAVVGTVGGAAVVRRLRPAGAGTAAILALSAVVTMGLTMQVILVHQWVLGREGLGVGWLALMVPGAIVGGGFVTQAMIPTRRIWMSGGGAVLFALLATVSTWEASWYGAVTSLMGSGFMLLCGAAGARFAWRVLGRAAQGALPDVPQARLHGTADRSAPG